DRTIPRQRGRPIGAGDQRGEGQADERDERAVDIRLWTFEDGHFLHRLDEPGLTDRSRRGRLLMPGAGKIHAAAVVLSSMSRAAGCCQPKCSVNLCGCAAHHASSVASAGASWQGKMEPL